MVKDVASITGLCIVVTVFCKLLEKYNKEYALFLSVALCSICLFVVFRYISPLLNIIETLVSDSGIDTSYASVIFKALGICYITQLASDVCRDCHETAIASVIEIVGKISLMLLALPLLETLLGIVKRLMEV